jgi:hypothetical protein
MSRYRLMEIKDPKRNFVIGPQAIAALIAVLLLYLATRGLTTLPIACTTAGTPTTLGTSRTYTTKFARTENPISGNDNWVNGNAKGIDWANVATMAGLAYGTESGSGGYDDSTALLTGTWGSNQMAEATVHTVNQNDNIYEEVELRLRSSLSAHRATGYEMNFRCSKTGNAYTQIVRWNGPLGDFTYLNTIAGSNYGVADGDVVKATIAGNVITAYISGVQVLQATDSTYATGSPGIGFYIQGTSPVSSDYGFTSFTASDQSQASAATNNPLAAVH